MMFILNPVMNSFSKPKSTETPNIPSSQERKFSEDKRFFIPLYLYLAVDTITQLWALTIVSDYYSFDTSFLANKMNGSVLKWGAFIFVWGYSTGIGGLAGHELIHKKESVHKFFGTYQFSRFLYGHFLMEHISGHHKNLATKDDPATPLIGDNLYSFSVRSAYVGFYNTLVRETKRINHLIKKKKDANFFTTITTHLLKNKMISISMTQVGYLYLIAYVFGVKAMLFQVAISMVGIFFVEWINFIEHYGLRRSQDNNGVYESITYNHSWNAYSTTLLFRIQRHSDHHAHAYRPYQILRLIENTPMLPYDYVMCFIISLCPPVWRAVMDPRVKSLKQKSKQPDPEEVKWGQTLVFYYYLVIILIVTGLTIYCL